VASLLAFGLVERARYPILTVLDVGQGDAAVLEDGRGGVTLVDGGPPGEAVVRWLRRTGRRRLAVVASHGHLDHVGGLGPVVAELEVTVVWATDHGGLGPLRTVAAARGLPWAWPPEAAFGAPTADGPNDRSLIWREGPFLLPGDLEASGERGLVGGPPAPASVLKVAHHGSAGATTEAWLEAVRPRVAVVSAGRGNGYGHPHDALLERLRARGVRVWRTDVHGTVSIAAAPEGLRVRSWRPGAGWTQPVTVGEMP
jgi:competence protein ComEC